MTDEDRGMCDCPECSGRDLVICKDRLTKKPFFVRCNSCMWYAPAAESKADAIAVWNTECLRRFRINEEKKKIAALPEFAAVVEAVNQLGEVIHMLRDDPALGHAGVSDLVEWADDATGLRCSKDAGVWWTGCAWQLVTPKGKKV